MCTVRYLTCVFVVCSLSEMAGIEITVGEKLHCREKSSHVGNKTRQTGTQLASSDPNLIPVLSFRVLLLVLFLADTGREV